MNELSAKMSARKFVATLSAVILTIGLCLPVNTAFATPSVSEAQNAVDQAKSNVAAKQQEVSQAKEKLDKLQEKLDVASDNYYNAVAEQEAAQKKVDKAQSQIQEETVKIKGFQAELGTRARSMYRTGTSSFLDVLLGAASFEQFANNLNLLNNMNEKDAELVRKTKESREKLEEAKAVYVEQEQIAEEKADEARVIKEEAESTANEAQQILDNLSEEEAQLLEAQTQAEEDLDAAQARAALEAEQARAAQEAQQSSNSGSSGSSNSGGSSYSSNNNKVQTVTGNTVVDRAYAQLGKPYRWGAAGPSSFDCSGLVGYALTGNMGSHWCTTGTICGWTRVTNPQPGDICINSHHTGVYIGNGQMIHAPHSGDVVRVSGVHSDMWYVRY